MTADATRVDGRTSTAAGHHDHRAGEHGADSKAQSAIALARFSLIYESRDGRLCVFEDADGHLTSVNSRRFA